MHRPRAALAALALVLAACADQGPGATGAASAPGITVGFGDPALPENRDRPAIEIVAVTALPIYRAELTLPDGSFVVGNVVEVERLDRPYSYGYGPSVGVGVGVGSWGGGGSTRVGTGVGIGVPLYGGGYAPPPQGLVRSRARVVPADMEAYRRDWQQSKLRLTLGAGPDAEKVEIPAPTPGAR